ncbi:MAG: ribosomal-protein-alanine acetyltransferase [Marinosulfonomonas sp.]|nr:MAG: ribosomal-protein-alanine acetyltransferase [Marinosulfonomonas sp.]
MTPAALAALHARCFVTPRPWSADEFASMLASSGVFLQSSDAGFVLGREIAGEAELLTLAVDPALQRQGNGRALLAGFEAEATKRGATDAFLEVADNNTAACALYRAAGYTESGRRPAYYRPPTGPKTAAIIMRKRLI